MAKASSSKPKAAAKAPKTAKKEDLKKEIKAIKPAKATAKDKKSDAKPKVKKETITTTSSVASASLSEEAKQWQEYKSKYGAEKAPNYMMSGVYEVNSGLNHKVLGWGFIISNTSDRLEVLFESGKKILISNYNAQK